MSRCRQPAAPSCPGLVPGSLLVIGGRYVAPRRILGLRQPVQRLLGEGGPPGWRRVDPSRMRSGGRCAAPSGRVMKPGFRAPLRSQSRFRRRAASPAPGQAPGQYRCPQSCGLARPPRGGIAQTVWAPRGRNAHAGVCDRDGGVRPRPARRARLIFPSKVNLKALERRLRITFSHRSRSR